MKIQFKTILRTWVKVAGIVAAINLTWFFVSTSKTGNLWPDVIGVVPIIFMSFVTILIASFVYWPLSFKVKRADLIFAIGAIIIAILSVTGNPKLSNGAIVPPEFRVMDVPMHFVAGLCAAFLIPLFCKNKLDVIPT